MGWDNHFMDGNEESFTAEELSEIELGKLEKLLAGYDRDACIKTLARIWARMEYLERLQAVKDSGFSDN